MKHRYQVWKLSKNIECKHSVPTSSYQLRVTNFELPTSSYQPQATNFELPTSSTEASRNIFLM